MSMNGVTAGALVPAPFAGSTIGWALLAASRHQVALIEAASSAKPARKINFVLVFMWDPLFNWCFASISGAGVMPYRSLPYPDSLGDPASLMHQFRFNAVLCEWPRRCQAKKQLFY